MTSTPKKMAAVVAGSAVLASAAYGVGTQVSDGNATAANRSTSSPAAEERRHGPRLSRLAEQLGVSEAKLRAALEDLRPARRAKGRGRAEMAAELAEELGVSESTVRGILADLRPRDGRAFKHRMPLRHRRPARMRNRLVAALAKGLDKDVSEIRGALRKVRAAHRTERAARRDEFAQKLADRLGISVDKLKSALPARGPGHHGPPPGGP